MNARSLLLLIGALVGVVLVVLFTRSYLNGLQQAAQTTPQQEPETLVIVAARDLPRGTILRLEDFDARSWPQSALSPSYLTTTSDRRSIADHVGKVVKDTIFKDNPIVSSSMVSQGQRGYMAAILKPGMRASTIAVNPRSSIGGFAFPGDRVDVILTHGVKSETNDALVSSEEERTVSSTILQNIRILAVDQRSETAPNEVRVPKTATLEVTPKIAEKLAMVSQLGTLSLTLRSLAQDGEPSEDPIGTAVSYTEEAEINQFFEPIKQEEAPTPFTVRRGSSAQVVAIAQSSSNQGLLAPSGTVEVSTGNQNLLSEQESLNLMDGFLDLMKAAIDQPSANNN